VEVLEVPPPAARANDLTPRFGRVGRPWERADVRVGGGIRHARSVRPPRTEQNPDVRRERLDSPLEPERRHTMRLRTPWRMIGAGRLE
jgi:hypothetical protein